MILSLTACVPVQETPCAVWPAPPPSERTDVPLEWMQGTVHLPVVATVVDGQAVRMAVDSGANVHFLHEDVAWWLRLPLADDRIAWSGDAAGETLAMRLRGPVVLALGVAALDRPFVLATRDVPTLLDAGLAGVLSPQRLAPEGGAIEVDLRARRLRALAPAEAAAILAPAPGWTALTPTCETNDGVALFLVDATIDGIASRLVVDSGSTDSFVRETSVVGRALAGRPTRAEARWVLGGEIPVDRADATVSLAGIARAASVAIQAAGPDECLGDGSLGIDVLDRCRLVLAARRAAIACDEG